MSQDFAISACFESMKTVHCLGCVVMVSTSMQTLHEC